MRILIFLGLLAIIEARRVKQGYKESFTFATIRRRDGTGPQKTVCANYLQYRLKLLPKSREDAHFYPLNWWRYKPWNTKVCPISSPGQYSYNGSLVPLDYRILDDGTNCTHQFADQEFKKAAQFEVDQLKANGVSAGLLLLDKGRQFVLRWRDFLFADFYDPYINASTAIPTFFMYSELLKSSLEELGLVDGSEAEIGFHRPHDSLFDVSMVIIWLLAMGCVAGGGAWAYHRNRLGKDKPTLSAAQATSIPSTDPSETEKEPSLLKKFCVSHANSIAIVILMVFLVAVLMTGFFFRSFLVAIFNVLVTVLGSISVFHCVRALLSNFACLRECKIYTAKPGFSDKILSWIGSHPSYLDILIYLCALTMCICWYVFRKDPYAFILLDVINVTLCLHILKSLRLPSVKWISCLMACMFIYDAVMVFVTPAFTSNGCSVMLEVATGIDCNSNSIGYPMPPVDATQPEKFPMLMQVMPFDSMTECMDLAVETSYPMTILGLGDIIIPGYLVTHCFTMVGFPEKIRLLYGIVCVLGYGVGLMVTFLALTLMHMAQPALIYLVPSTLIPIYLLACCRGEFKMLWSGVVVEEKSATESDTETVHLSTSEQSPVAEL